MELYGDGGSIILIDTADIIKIVRSSLSLIDPRLIGHGERVGYITYYILGECADRGDFDISKLLILCALHDIGAYKTNEIDDMIRFETEDVSDHSLFGYLFLKHTTHLSDCAEAVLYHHTDYCSDKLRSCRYAKYAQMIHLADRADILMTCGAGDLSALRSLAGTKFNPDYVEALLRAEEKHGVAAKLTGGGFRDEYDALAARLDIKNNEIIEYLKLLVYAIDFRSPYTVTHTADTTAISVETGRLLGLGERDLQALYLGAFLHDIGKIAIPHDILEKPGKLTPEEYDVVRRHIPEGEHILRGVVSDEICDIALRHHEKLDGSGYSRGLTADALTLPQRIVAVADIFSALSQRRSYKDAFPKELVVSILTEMRDAGQLCPLVVDTVCEHYDSILRSTERNHNPIKELYGSITDEYNQRVGEMRERKI